MVASWSCAPDGRPRPHAPFGRGPMAARVLGRVIDAAALVGCRVPVSIAEGFAVVGGHLEWAARRGKRRILAENLAHAVSEPPRSRPVRRLVRREIVNEARRSADLLWAIGRPERAMPSFEVDGVGHVIDALARGRGVVLAGVHLGGWEVVAAAPGTLLPVPTTVVVADDWLAWGMQHVRAAAGLRVAYRSRSGIAFARVLRRGEALLVLGDDASGAPPRRHTVCFCGSVAALPAGIVTLSRLTGAPVIPFAVVRLGPRRWRIVVDQAIDAPPRRAGEGGERAALQRLADRWSQHIEAHADQWAASFPIAWGLPG